MKSKLLLFLTTVTGFGLAVFLGLVAPQWQVGQLSEFVAKPLAWPYPTPRSGLAAQGREVYRSLGCAACHTQQVRPPGNNADLARGWGIRRTVARDYLADPSVHLGQCRLGPDLANLGGRPPHRYAVPWAWQSLTNRALEMEQWHGRHLYDPRAVAPGSFMPSYKSLFIERDIKPGRAPDPQALRVGYPSGKVGDGKVAREIVPGPQAKALVAYLLSLRAEVPLYEAPVLRVTNHLGQAPAGGNWNRP